MVAAFFVSLMAAAASAAKVPGLLLLSGESGLLTFSGSSAAQTELQSAAGTFVGEGMKLSGTLATDDEGTYIGDFENIKNKRNESCQTAGDAAGTVLISSNKARAVHDVSSTTGNGLLLEIQELEVICAGAEKVHLKGTMISLFEGVGTKEGNDFKAFAGSLYCKNMSGGEPLVEKFWGLSGVEEKAKLEANFGSGFKKACKLVGTIAAGTKVELITNKMAELMEVG